MKLGDIAIGFRQRRMRKFLEIVPSHGDVRILDLGGTAAYWRMLPGLYRRRQIEITILNLDAEEGRDGNLLVRRGDACDTGLADMSFDIVHSNSVIEHVGNWQRIGAMADEVSRLAPSYFVQTPNFWFPIEPHYKLPAVQWLPRHMKGVITRDDPDRIHLLGATQMQQLFPDAELWREKFLGLTKSLVAIRTDENAASLRPKTGHL